MDTIFKYITIGLLYLAKHTSTTSAARYYIKLSLEYEAEL